MAAVASSLPQVINPILPQSHSANNASTPNAQSGTHPYELMKKYFSACDAFENAFENLKSHRSHNKSEHTFGSIRKRFINTFNKKLLNKLK